MYCIFLIRLDIVYSNSAYGYPRYFIYSAMIFVVIASITLSSILISSIDESLFLTDNDGIPDPCFVFYPPWGYFSFLVYDFAANFMCLILFIVPLIRVIRSVRGNAKNNKASDAMIYVGIKLLVITAVCVFTTVLTLSLLTSGHAGYMAAVDVFVNSVCVCLATAYYPDHVYYERLCYLCLCCCPVKYRSKGKRKKMMNPLEQQQTVMAVQSKSSKMSSIEPQSNDGVQVPDIEIGTSAHV